MKSTDAIRIHIWDLPLRLFHWLLPLLLGVSWISAEVGGNAMQVHELSGYALLTLVLFRLLWGLWGSSTARFSGFVRGVGPVLDYARSLRQVKGTPQLGHNPLAGWMVLALLAVLLGQAVSGLFATDDAGVNGPLASWISYDLREQVTDFHHLNFDILLGLVGLHVAAVLLYVFKRGDNIVRPMLSGHKEIPVAVLEAGSVSRPVMAHSGLALLLLAVAAVGVVLLVRFG